PEAVPDVPGEGGHAVVRSVLPFGNPGDQVHLVPAEVLVAVAGDRSVLRQPVLAEVVRGHAVLPSHPDVHPHHGPASCCRARGNSVPPMLPAPAGGRAFRESVASGWAPPGRPPAAWPGRT